MDAIDKVHAARMGALRNVAVVLLVGVTLSGCSAVPDAVNPVKWYEKTTDFFSGDTQAAGASPATVGGGNQGLAADPNAPAPAPAAAPVAAVTSAPSGLNADQVAGNYASPPIERQGAPSDVLRPDTAVPQASQTPPPPPIMAQPTMPVAPAPIAPPASAAPTAPAAPLTASQMPERPASMSMADAPPPPVFNAPANAVNQLGDDVFETVVISSDGMDAIPQSRMPTQQAALPVLGAQGAQGRGGAMFPEPGATTTGQGGVAPSNLPAGTARVATIHFANNSSLLDSRDRSILGAVIQLQRERGGRVVVVGHASARTKDMDYITHQMVNFQISMERAASIGDALKQLGLEGEALEIQAVSDSAPLYMEVMPSGEAGNRRVEIYLAL